MLFFLTTGFSVVTVVGMNALMANDEAKPPRNMHKVRFPSFIVAPRLVRLRLMHPFALQALLFEGVFVFVTAFFIFALQGKQGRKEVDTKAVAHLVHHTVA